MEIGAIDEGCEDPAEAVSGADLVILATPVGLFRDIIQKIAKTLGKGAILTDVGSTKRSIVRDAEESLPKSVRFVGSHPMAGSEKRGVDYARTDLFQGAMCLMTPTRKTDKTALAAVEGFWQSLGMQTKRLTPELHDQLLAEVSHLPHAVAAAMVAMQSDEGLGLTGKGFLDTTRIAGGDGGLWRDIFFDNRDNVKAALGKLRAELDGLLAKLEPGQEEALRKWLDSAAQRRQKLLEQKLREINPD